jgi:hypothetical protein
MVVNSCKFVVAYIISNKPPKFFKHQEEVQMIKTIVPYQIRPAFAKTGLPEVTALPRNVRKKKSFFYQLMKNLLKKMMNCSGKLMQAVS